MHDARIPRELSWKNGPVFHHLVVFFCTAISSCWIVSPSSPTAKA